MRRTRLLALIACTLALAAHAHDDPHDNGHDIGIAGDKAHVNRTIRVTMSDEMRFTPASVNARQGETIRFIVSNAGKLKHEFVLGTAQGLAAHAEAMKKFPDMHHSAPNMVSLEAGATGEVIWRFTKPGAIAFACLQAGHYDAGMKGAVHVAATVHS